MVEREICPATTPVNNRRRLNSATRSGRRNLFALRAGFLPDSGRTLSFFVALMLGLGSALAQEQHKVKVPGLAKVTRDSSFQAFNGRVQSLDMKTLVLHINAIEGRGTEIFSLKKGVRVATADGGKLKLSALIPGTNVIVYYNLKEDQRTVKEIIVLAARAPEGKKAPSPP